MRSLDALGGGNYVMGMITVTVTCNVPLNDQLEVIDANGDVAALA